MPTKYIVENCVTILGTVVLVLGLYAMGAGLWSFGGLFLMFNLYYPKSSR